MSNFNLFKNRLRLTGTLELETALRVGSGSTDNLSSADISVVKDNLYRPYIPGSSFKGVLRAHIERVIRLVEPNCGRGLGACNPLRDDERCLSNTQIENLKKEFEKDPQRLDAELFDRSCRICRVFGAPWLASKVLIKDLLLAHPDLWMERRYQVRNGVGIDRDNETASQGLLYDYEVVPSGTLFNWEIIIENADQSADRTEDGLVMLGLNEFANGRVQLGGGRSHGLGWVKLHFDDEAEIIDASNRDDFIKYLATGKGCKKSREYILKRAVLFASILAKQEGKNVQASI
ncbi:MAG: CRISPR-associated RAMP protein [Methanothrix sp.]|nr:MAG: CRISPR-associated RAMP protein [Methanothrix sp.]